MVTPTVAEAEAVAGARAERLARMIPGGYVHEQPDAMLVLVPGEEEPAAIVWLDRDPGERQ